MTEAVLKEAQDLWHRAYDMGASCADGQFVDLAAILVIAEALRARDERIAELEQERENLSGLVQGWHYLAVGPDEMGDYHTQKQLIKLSEPYASPALKALKEKNDDA